MKRLSALQLWFGIVFVLAFLVTGLYLEHLGTGLEQGDQGVRMMYRATHIYLLFASLLNVVAGGFETAASTGPVAWLDATARLLLLLGPPLFLIGFFVEPPVYAIERPLSFWGVVACATGVGLMGIGRWLPLARWITPRNAARANGNPPRLRPAKQEEMPRLDSIREAAFAPIFAGFQRTLGEPLYSWVQAADDAAQGELLRDIAAEGSVWELFVAELGGEIAGFVSLRADADKGVGEIGLNAVDPHHAGRGVGAHMYRFAVERLREQGMKAVVVGTGGDAQHAAARRAYQKVGFDVGIPSVWLVRKL